MASITLAPNSSVSCIFLRYLLQAKVPLILFVAHEPFSQQNGAPRWPGTYLNAHVARAAGRSSSVGHGREVATSVPSLGKHGGDLEVWFNSLQQVEDKNKGS